MNNRRAKASLKKYTSHFICNVCVWEGVGDRTELQYIDPHSYGRQRCVFLVLQGCSTGGPGASSLLDDGFLYCILSPTGLVPKLHRGSTRASSAGCGFPYNFSSLIRLWSPTVWLPVLTELYNSSTPTRSPTQSLEWHDWSSSSGNNCHIVQRSLTSGASVYECIMGFYLVPFRLRNPPTRFLSITGHWNVSLPFGASLWNGMFGRVECQNTTTLRLQIDLCTCTRH